MLTASTTTGNDHWIEILGIKRTKVSVLIIGNNPIEMTGIYNILVGFRSKSYLTDVCFNLKDCFDRINKSKPEVILVDDNLGAKHIQKMALVLRQNPKTSNIKIIALRSSSRSFQAIKNIDDHIIKDSINAKSLDKTIDKSLQPQLM